MARQHFRCPNCGTIQLVSYTVADVGDPEVWPPRCDSLVSGDADHDLDQVRLGQPVYWCGTPMERAPQPGDFIWDLKTDGESQDGRGKGFQKFVVHRQAPDRDGTLVQVAETIDSLHSLRRIERESEQRYIDGEGEPLRFRGYAQNASNMDVGAFGREGTIGVGSSARSYDSGKALPAKPKKVDIRRHGETKPRVSTARGGGASPLKDL